MHASFVLLHSPLVGPATWRPVADALRARGVAARVPSLLGFEASPPPYLPRIIEAAAAALAALDGPAVLVAHSGAGLLLPAIGERAPNGVGAYLFADAQVPAREPRDDPAFRARLEALAEHGMLPPWSQWFGEGVMERLVPDAALRAEVERELPRLPLAYFDERAPLPERWPDAPCGYLRFSEAYADASAEAQHRGWLVERLSGAHLHMLVEPDAVAERLLAMAAQLVGG